MHPLTRQRKGMLAPPSQQAKSLNEVRPQVRRAQPSNGSHQCAIAYEGFSRPASQTAGSTPGSRPGWGRWPMDASIGPVTE